MTDDDSNNHGTNVLKFLVEPWVRMDCCVCADSYFASANAVTVMRTIGLRFIGVVKTATKQFPMSYLSNLQLVQCRDYKGLVARGTDWQPTMLSFIWMDQDHCYFIASASLLDSGIPYSRNRWRQVSLGQKSHHPGRGDIFHPGTVRRGVLAKSGYTPALASNSSIV